MDRKEFIRTCGSACLGIAGLSLLAESCTPVHYIQATGENNRLTIAQREFIYEKNGKRKERRYIIVKAPELDFPVVVYRFSATVYSALLLKCTHQGNELAVNGDLLTCSAHGSEFNTKGEVVQGPAEKELKRFGVTADADHIYIQLS